MRARLVEILVIALGLALAGWLGWRRLHPEDRACAKLVKLCKPADAQKSLDECNGLLADERARLGGSRARAQAQCVLDADDCKQSIDCLYRAGKKRATW